MRFSGHQVELYDWLNQHTTGLAGDLDKEESIEPWQQPYDGLEHKPTLFGLNRFQLYKIMGVFLSGVFSGVFFSPVLFLLGAAATTAYSGRLLYRSYRRGLLSERREANHLPESRREALTGVWRPDLGRESKRLPD